MAPLLDLVMTWPTRGANMLDTAASTEKNRPSTRNVTVNIVIVAVSVTVFNRKPGMPPPIRLKTRPRKT